MKLKEYLYMLGIKPKGKTYGFELCEYELAGFPKFTYAHWLHPKEKRKTFESAQLDELRKYIDEGDFCLDIGAHSGDTVVPMALAVGRSGLVIAMEPNQYVFPSLNATSLMNTGHMNVVPVMAAASDRYGVSVFEYSDSGYCNGGKHEGISKWAHGHAFELEVLTVDIHDYLVGSYNDRLGSLRFVKVDTEGYDYYILLRMKSILEKYKPYIKAEIYKKTDAEYRYKMFDYLSELGYSIYHVNTDSDLCGELIARRDDMCKHAHYDIFAVPG